MQNYFVATVKAYQGKTKQALFASLPQKKLKLSLDEVLAQVETNRMKVADLRVSLISPKEARIMSQIHASRTRIQAQTQELLKLQEGSAAKQLVTQTAKAKLNSVYGKFGKKRSKISRKKSLKKSA